MRLKKLIWPHERIEHIAKHNVSTDEVKQVCFGNSLVQRGKSHGVNPVYYYLGQTDSGRYLFCVIVHFPDMKIKRSFG